MMHELFPHPIFPTWRRIRYFTAGTSGPPLLLLHGFGVGAYHYERNIDELSKTCRVFAVDVLGQGSSWPSRPATQEDGLYISIDTWISQITDFATEVGLRERGSEAQSAGWWAADGLEENTPALSLSFPLFLNPLPHLHTQPPALLSKVMGVSAEQPTYIAGNSLGGLLAVYMGAMHADLVRGLVLLNATPFWSFRPPLKAQNQGVWGLFPEGFGLVPVPDGLKSFIERLWWNK
jgi:pimeloyl-ACP methyl ester carboxylesterase